MKFNEKLFELRKSNGLSQEQLAEKLDVSRQAVSKWETGDAFPEASKLFAIAKLFDVTTDYLLDDSLDRYTQPKAADRPDALDRVASSAGKIFEKYGWILGIILALYGLWKIVSNLFSIGSFGHAASATGNIGFVVLPALSLLSGLIFLIAGIMIAVKLKKKK